MKPRVCICCGESMTAAGNELSRNPNVCSSCSSLVDGMDEASFLEQLTSEGPLSEAQTRTESAVHDQAVGRGSGSGTSE